MNLLKASQLQDGGYHYTITNDHRTRAHPCCAAHNLTPHATEEEAERCAYEYELARSAYHDNSRVQTAHPCAECGEWTPGLYVIGGMDMVSLCPTHGTPDMLRKHHPFKPGMMSWES